jgi:hypothetical protein
MKREELVELALAAAKEAANFQERFAAEDTESRKIVTIMEKFLRMKQRVVYGGAAINAHMSAKNKFYDPRLNLPDYDFMTPDPLQDCADLIVEFQREGFEEVEAKFGIHEGTYKIFVNFRAAADVTYMPPAIYERIYEDAKKIDGITYASPNFLRMNMYLEISRPAGDVSRWEKVYKRLLLLNEEHPLKAGHCPSHMFKTKPLDDTAVLRHDRIVGIGIEGGAIFLSGLEYLEERKGEDGEPVIPLVSDDVILMMSNRSMELVTKITEATQMIPTPYEELGELLPPRTEFHTRRGKLVAVVFETVACHAYTTLARPAGYRLGSLDLMIQMYYAMYFADLKGYVPYRLLCVIQKLIDMNDMRRLTVAKEGGEPHDVFPLECIGHQPTLPELKRAHRKRVVEKRKELMKALKKEGRRTQSSGVRLRLTKRGSRRDRKSN